MEIQFKECDWFDLWIWLTFPDVPAEAEKQLLDEVFTYLVVVKLGTPIVDGLCRYNPVRVMVATSGVSLLLDKISNTIFRHIL